MRTWAKWAIPSVLALAAGTAIAADHRDGSDAIGDPTSDINDLYAWTNSGKDTVYLALTVGGFGTAPDVLSSSVLYSFHVFRGDKPPALGGKGTDTDLTCRVASKTSAECWLGNADYVTGDPSGAMGMTSASGNLQVHIGKHADPFFFFLLNTPSGLTDKTHGGLNTVIPKVQSVAGQLSFNMAGCPTLDQGTVNLLDSMLTHVSATGMAPYDQPPVNTFATNNAQVIVAAVKKAAIPGTGENFAIWASTNKPAAM